jgi:uncharacterized damage-inducible protein DinB
LVESLIAMPGHFGIEVEGHEMVENNQICPPPATMAEIKDAYERASNSFLKGVESWTDEMLMDKVDMYGEVWSKSHCLSVLMCHQIHHRSEIIVLMRQAGLVPPAIYGPNKEDWAAFGAEAPKV